LLGLNTINISVIAFNRLESEPTAVPKPPAMGLWTGVPGTAAVPAPLLAARLPHPIRGQGQPRAAGWDLLSPGGEPGRAPRAPPDSGSSPQRGRDGTKPHQHKHRTRLSLHRFTESQNVQGWQGPLWVTQPNPLPKQGHSPHGRRAAAQTFRDALKVALR